MKSYTVKTIIGAVDKTGSVFRSIGAKAKTAFTPLMSGLSKDLGRLKTVAVGGLVGGLGVGALVKGLVDANAQAETTELALTSLIQSADKASKGPLTRFQDAFGESGRLMAAMRREAVSTPATFEQVADAFQQVAFMGRKAGASYDELARLSGNIATVDLFSGGMGNVGRDVNQLLMGKGGDDIDTAVLKSIAPEVKKLVKRGKLKQALAKITESLEQDPELRKRLGESWEGQVATLKDQIAEVQRTAGKPLFEEAKSALTYVSKWIAENPNKVRQMARDFGAAVVSVAKGVRDAFSFVIDNASTIKNVGLALAIAWTGKRVWDFGAGLLKTGKGILDTLRGVSAAGGALGAASSLGGKGCCCGGALAGAGKAGGILGGLGRLAGAVGVAAAAIGLLAPVIDKVVKSYDRTGNETHNKGVQAYKREVDTSSMFGGFGVAGWKEYTDASGTHVRRQSPNVFDKWGNRETDIKSQPMQFIGLSAPDPSTLTTEREKSAVQAWMNSQQGKFAMEMEVLFKNVPQGVEATATVKQAPAKAKVRSTTRRGPNRAGTAGGTE